MRLLPFRKGPKKIFLNYSRFREERVHVIHNGIDLNEFRKVESHEVLTRFGIPHGKPYLLFVGRITRQKGIIYLLEALSYLDPDFPVVLCASSPDTPGDRP